jgi:hypothetical protein
MTGVAIASHPEGTINITWAGVVGNPNPPPPAGKKTVNVEGKYKMDKGNFEKVTYTLYKKNAMGGWDPVPGVVDVQATSTSTPTAPNSGTFTGKKHDVGTGADYLFIVTLHGKFGMGEVEDCDDDASSFNVPN